MKTKFCGGHDSHDGHLFFGIEDRNHVRMLCPGGPNRQGSTHGLAQSEALSHVAKSLSNARKTVEEMSDWNIGNVSLSVKADAQSRLELIEAAYRDAYREYTNPFNVVKTFS